MGTSISRGAASCSAVSGNHRSASCTNASARTDIDVTFDCVAVPIGGKTNGSNRNADSERRAGAGFALRMNMAAVELDQFLHESEANTAAFVGAALLTLNTMEAFEKTRQFVFRYADTGVADRQCRKSIHCAQGNCYLAFEGELERIGEKIKDDLLPHIAIDVDGPGQGGAVDDQPKARMLARRTEIAGKLGGECSQIYGLVGNLRTACFDAGEIKQRVDKLQQPKRVAMGDVEPFAFVRRQVRTGERVLQRAERQRQGRAETRG